MLPREHTSRMSSLYPAKRIPQGLILIGSAFVAVALVIAVAHFGFGVPVYNRSTSQPSSDLTVAILVAAFGGIGSLLAMAGRAVLRAASRHHSKRVINGNGS